MEPTGIFITCIASLLVFNFVAGSETFTFFSFVSLLAAMIPVCIVSGIQILGSGLSETATKSIFGIGVLLSVLGRLDLPAPIPFDIGLGLGTQAIAMLPITAFGGLPFFVVTTMVIIAFISGVMAIMGG